jgi:CBS domain-containing protein
MKVADIMTKDVVTVRPDTPVGEVAQAFRSHGLSGLPVVSAEGELLGVITERDMIIRHARPHLPAFLPVLGAYIPLGRKEYQESLRRITGVVAQDIMTTPPKTIGPDADIEELASLMVEEDINPVPVVDETGRMIGIVSHTDILQVFEDAESRLEDSLDEGDAQAG